MNSSTGCYLSLKLPALRYSQELLREVAQRAREAGVRLHFDGMAPDSVDRTWTALDDLQREFPGLELSCTLPGRWPRSVDDARWACERGLAVRVVKGEWPDPAAPRADLTAGFLNVIDALTGKARRVSVATHVPRLAADALGRLQAAGTPCDLELLYGLPMRGCLRVAAERSVPVRVYVPYGEAYMPYALSQIAKKPQVLGWLARDFAAGLVRRGPLAPSAGGR